MSKDEITKSTVPPAPGYPNPQQLAVFKEIDPTLPSLMVKATMLDRLYEFVYAFVGQLIAGGTLLGVIAAFVYLVMQNHSQAAYILGGGSVISIIGLLLRNRLNKPAEMPSLEAGVHQAED